MRWDSVEPYEELFLTFVGCQNYCVDENYLRDDYLEGCDSLGVQKSRRNLTTTPNLPLILGKMVAVRLVFKK